MEDDPNRDIFPVKEGSCTDTCRSDPRERHFVCKLDRYQLEDKYLRLLEETQCMKKLSNRQEDKIKRLATKLMRVSANPRACINVHDICNDKEKISNLECENNKLKEKVNVLRNQLLSHVTQRRSPSRCRQVTGTPSGATTCRSENIRLKTPSCNCLVQTEHDGSDIQKYLQKIQELETQKKEMASRISELDNELASNMTGNRREKIAENVEHIRALRQMKEYTEKLTVFKNENDSLNEQVVHLKKLLGETTRNNKEITAALMIERKKMTEMDEQMIKAKDSQLSLREKDEQIRDLMNEMKILQQHNSELIDLSSKYSQIEVENMELKKKISEQMSDHQILKNAFNNEQANITALQSANSQLLAKLHELQRNIDTLNIQLMAFQGKPRKQEKIPKVSSKEHKSKYSERRISSSSTGSLISEYSCTDLTIACKKICDEVKQKPGNNIAVEKESQTEGSYLQDSSRHPKKEEVIIQSQENSVRKETPERRKSQDMNGHAKTVPESPLSRERMLKLLEQAQINTPFETQNIRLKQVTPVSESVQKQRLKERRILENSKSPENINKQNIIYSNSVPTKDPNQILSHFSEILHEYNVLKTGKINCVSSLEDNENHLDLNNNKSEKSEEECICDSEDINNNNIYTNKNEIMETNSKNSKSTEEECSCICDGRCPNNFYRNINGKYVCCCTENSVNQIETINCEPCSKPARLLENVVVDINSSIRKTFDTMYFSRKRISSENENSPCMEKKIHHEKKEDNLCKEFFCEESAFREVVKKYAKDHFDRSNAGKSTRKDSKIIKENYQKIFEEPITELTEEEICNCYDNNNLKLEYQPMLITKDQGHMEVHIVCLQLSKTAVRLLFEDASFFISWKIRGHESSFTPILKYPELNFDTSSIFVISEVYNFLDYIFEEYITFQVHVLYPNETTYVIAQTKLCVKEILDYPNNKMQYISSVNSIIPCSLRMNFGQLSLWVRLSCDLNKIKNFKTQRGIINDNIEQKPITRMKKRSKDKRDIVYSSDSSNLIAKKKKLDGKEKYVPLDIYKEDKLLEKDDRKKLNTMSSIQEVSSNIESSSYIIPDNIDNKRESKLINAGSLYNLDSTMKNSKIIESKSTSNITENESTSDETIGIINHPKVFSNIRNDDRKLKKLKSKSTLHTSNFINTEDIVEFKKMISDISLAPIDSNSTMRDVNEVLMDDNWDKYKARNLGTKFGQDTRGKIEDEDIHPLNEEDEKLNRIIIELNSISFYEETFTFLDPNISQIYIEYSFLGYFGEEMETLSAPVPEPSKLEIIYDYKKEFQVDEKNHSKQREILREMLSEKIDPNVKFILVSEPLPDERDKECEEIGFALLNLKDYATGDYLQKMSLSIMNNEQNKSLGILRITVDGLDAMKSCL